ncbi:hypothetical protein GOBAR_AA04406 [Gossypium barbadense]|uniref:Uncharacterized protein n=1 Tax=Gossypium barbadense TaxID=3634 RepID=A0A2P5YKM2_GOSBA|nr:hypothetical protein GOBAR_AA04406 [Gossypium barbadense]
MEFTIIHFILNGCHTSTPRSYLASTGSVGQSKDVRSKCANDSVRDGGNARIGPGDAAIWVEETNFIATTRLEGAA